MLANKKVTGKAFSMAAGLGIGAAISLLITMLGAMIAANLIITEKIGAETVGYCAIVVLILGASLGALTAAILIKHRWMVVCAGVGGLYYLALLAVTALFFGGQYQGMGVTALAVFGSSIAIGLIGLNKGNGASKKRKIHHFR